MAAPDQISQTTQIADRCLCRIALFGIPNEPSLDRCNRSAAWRCWWQSAAPRRAWLRFALGLRHAPAQLSGEPTPIFDVHRRGGTQPPALNPPGWPNLAVAECPSICAVARSAALARFIRACVTVMLVARRLDEAWFLCGCAQPEPTSYAMTGRVAYVSVPFKV
jgi:hypothetical protein